MRWVKINSLKGLKEKSLVVFQHGFEVDLDVSEHMLETQLDRAKVCRYMFADEIEQ